MNERGPVMDTSRMAAAQQRRRQRERIGVDPRCVELAAHFLSDAPNSKPEDVTELAEIIQCRVESFIADIGLPLTDVQRSIRDGTFRSLPGAQNLQLGSTQAGRPHYRNGQDGLI